jgi:hypothetical protein
MVPTDSDFLMIYFLYASLLAFFVINLIRSNYRKVYLINLCIYAVYLIFAISLFVDEDNFKYGGSLVVFFYTFLLPIVHILLYFLSYLAKHLYLMAKNKDH